jgi:hypothetical protein
MSGFAWNKAGIPLSKSKVVALSTTLGWIVNESEAIVTYTANFESNFANLI